MARLLTASGISSMVMALSHSALALSDIWGIFIFLDNFVNLNPLTHLKNIIVKSGYIGFL